MEKERGLLDGHHGVLTPEYVEFNFVVAGLFSRFLAYVIDLLISAAILFFVIVIVAFVSVALPGLGAALWFVGVFAIHWVYDITMETWWSGQTVGKRAMGLRVIQESGVRISFIHAALRNLARPIDNLPVMYLVGGVSALFSPKHQRLGDLLAGTLVVRERKLKVPAALARPEGETTLLDDPTFRMRVGKLTEEEEALLFAAAIRREELGMEARLNLFSELSKRLQEDLDFYKPAHLSDEKLVLLVTAALMARSQAKKRRGTTQK